MEMSAQTCDFTSNLVEGDSHNASADHGVEDVRFSWAIMASPQGGDYPMIFVGVSAMLFLLIIGLKLLQGRFLKAWTQPKVSAPFMGKNS